MCSSWRPPRPFMPLDLSLTPLRSTLTTRCSLAGSVCTLKVPSAFFCSLSSSALVAASAWTTPGVSAVTALPPNGPMHSTRSEQPMSSTVTCRLCSAAPSMATALPSALTRYHWQLGVPTNSPLTSSVAPSPAPPLILRFLTYSIPSSSLENSGSMTCATGLGGGATGSATASATASGATAATTATAVAGAIAPSGVLAGVLNAPKSVTTSERGESRGESASPDSDVPPQ
mmetsp:Transcript_78997/g.191030  ORF Transcript_78997/g.191030 Transcript_78997/m.191030 type:complete len:230 (+) Transcript_78997:745-1434(+)